MDHKEGVDVEARGHEVIHQSISLPGEELDHKEGVGVEARGHEVILSPYPYLTRRWTTRKG